MVPDQAQRRGDRYLVDEKIFKRRQARQRGPPDTAAIRAARTNLRYHLAISAT